MTDAKVPDSDHISRFCRPMQAPDGVIQATAFLLRENEEKLSVNWLEYLNCLDRNSEINEIRRVYYNTFTVGASARIAVLNVGQLRAIVSSETQDKRNLEVLHAPNSEDPSHSEISNLKHDDEFIAELILEIVQDDYPARYQ